MAYGSIAEVTAFTRHLLDGQSAYNSTTRPTSTEITAFLNRCSAMLDLSLAKRGFTVPITNTTCKFVLDDWVTMRSVEMVEATQRGTGYSAEDGSRTSVFRKLASDAEKLVSESELGFKRMGADVAHASSEGVTFTGLDLWSDRSDPDDTTLEQPQFTRHKWDNVEDDDR